MTGTKNGLLAGIVMAMALGCVWDPPAARVELTRAPLPLSGEPQVLSADPPLSAESVFLGVCVFPTDGRSARPGSGRGDGCRA